MYSELVESLRICGHWKDEDSCNGCMYHDAENNVCKSWIPNDNQEERIMLDAADAIEELSLTAESYKRSMEAWAQEAVNAQPHWIPVTEKPPLKVGDDGYNGYLVYANGYYAVADYTTDKIDDVPYFYVDGEYEPDVTHWMPLPEPPKEETE